MKTPKPSLLFSATRISRNIQIAPGVFILSFPLTFSFRAGQVLGLRLQHDQAHRLYSIASGEKEDEVSILFDINPSGMLTPDLARLKEGDYLEHTQPFGYFFAEPGPSYWIGTGTGIAPFRSMLRSGQQQGKTLIHGAREASHFFFQEEFSEALQEKYIRCSSRQEIEGIYYGRLTHYLRETEDLDVSASFLLCGSAEMVVEVRDLLLDKGVSFSKIRAEIYF